MPKDYSPFTPGQPVPLEFFVGRRSEVEHLMACVRSSVSGRLQAVFVSGERGIGKSSLAAMARFLAERDERVLGLHTFLGGVTSLEELARRVFDRLVKQSVDQPWFERVRQFLGNRVRQVGLFGISVEFGARQEDLRRLVHDFVPALRGLIQRLGDEKRGILLILDDINGLSARNDFANWLKSLVDEIATSRQTVPLCLTLVGLEDRRRELVATQPSLSRVFDLIDIPAWTDDEAELFFANTFRQVGVDVSAEASRLLVHYAGGLPVLAHEIGDATFKADTDNCIDAADAQAGIVTAAEIVGRKLLEPQVLQTIRSDRYRTILRKIARPPFGITFRRAELVARLDAQERRVLDNFLNRMKRLGVVQPDPNAGRGAYRFTNRLHYLYFAIEAERANRG